MTADEIANAFKNCIDVGCDKCGLFGPCNGTFDAAIHIAAEKIIVQAAEIAELQEQLSNSRFADCHIWEPGDKLDTISDKCEVLIKAADIKALRQPANEPLTLDELRGMDGEPVWLNDTVSPECSGWHLVNINLEDSFLIDRWGWQIPLQCLGDWRPAYRRKPEGGDR